MYAQSHAFNMGGNRCLHDVQTAAVEGEPSQHSGPRRSARCPTASDLDRERTRSRHEIMRRDESCSSIIARAVGLWLIRQQLDEGVPEPQRLG
jgi:hypothetical protein